LFQPGAQNTKWGCVRVIKEMFKVDNIQEFVNLDKTNQAAVLASYMSLCKEESLYMALELVLLPRYGVDGLCLVIGKEAGAADRLLHVRGRCHE
jgi:hypothetical protein